MIVYGSKMYFKKNVVRSFGECQYCGTYGEQASYQAKKYGHLYFIPLIPLGAKSQVLNECSACDMGAHIPLQDLEPRLDELKVQFKNWITEVQEGKTEIMAEGTNEPVNAGVLIAGILEDLYCLNEIGDVDSISQILGDNNMEFENHIVVGRWNEMRGDLQEASSSYEAAHRVRPDDPVPLYQMGTVAVKLGNAESAEQAFEKYLAICPEDFSAYIELATLYETRKNYSKIVKSYDQLYSMKPELLADKGMKKVYRKACRKSGEPGQFLSQI